MSKPNPTLTENTPLVGSSYQDVEHQADAHFEEVQDIGHVRSSKSRLVLAAALLTGVAVAGFGGGFRAETASIWGKYYGGKKHQKKHKKNPSENFTIANYTGPGAYELKMAAIKKSQKKAVAQEAELEREQAAAIAQEEATLAAEEKKEEAKVEAELKAEEKKLEAAKYQDLQAADKGMIEKAEAALNTTLNGLEAKEEKIEASRQSLIESAKNLKKLHNQELELLAEKEALRAKEGGELDAIGMAGGKKQSDEEDEALWV